MNEHRYSKPDPFLFDYDTARFAYLLARELEIAYRKVQKQYRKRSINPEKILFLERRLNELAIEYETMEERLKVIIKDIKDNS